MKSHLAWNVLNPKQLSEDEFKFELVPRTVCQRKKSSWPCSIQKYCRVQRNSYSGKNRGRLTMKRNRGGPAGSVKANDALSTCWKVPSIGPERGKSPWGSPVSATNTDEEKSGSVVLWLIPPAYSMFHHEFLAMKAESSAVPGRHAMVGQMSPGVAHNYYYIGYAQISVPSSLYKIIDNQSAMECRFFSPVILLIVT